VDCANLTNFRGQKEKKKLLNKKISEIAKTSFQNVSLAISASKVNVIKQISLKNNLIFFPIVRP